jgi:hypothetical protein
MKDWENWDLNRVDRRKTETAEMEFLLQVSGHILCYYVYSNLV